MAPIDLDEHGWSVFVVDGFVNRSGVRGGPTTARWCGVTVMEDGLAVRGPFIPRSHKAPTGNADLEGYVGGTSRTLKTKTRRRLAERTPIKLQY